MDRPLTRAEPLVYRWDAVEIPGTDRVGGKAHNLARLGAALRTSDAHATVPHWVAISVLAFERLVLPLGAPPRDPAAAESHQRAVRSLALPEEFRAEVRAGLTATGLAHARLAVRSSGVAEDAADASFAGQFDTVLGVPSDSDVLWDAIRRVWASAFHVHAAAYQQRGGAAPLAPRMAVILQELVDADAAGVVFAADPVTGDTDVAVVSAVLGLGEGLVSGELDADTFRVRKGSPDVETSIAVKDRAARADAGGGTSYQPVAAELQLAPSISADEAHRIAACAWQLSYLLGRPQDIEWALVRAGSDGGARRLVVLQTRPITRLGRSLTIPFIDRRVWDNSNIVESYSGVTTPLTFSFARSVYEDVYRQFCRLMGVSEARLVEHRRVFANMLGLVRGRVYYNLLNWYRTLALLPGFSFNREFMERMMGVRERLERAPSPQHAASRLEDLLRLVRMIIGMSIANARLGRDVPAFHARVDRVLAPLAAEDLSARPPEELVKLYERLERELLHHWRAPLVNDFFAMVWFGTLGKLIEKWLPAEPPTIANDLLCGEGGIISTEPARLVMAMAREVSAQPGLRSLFDSEPDDAALWSRIHAPDGPADLRSGLDAYVARFGDRCMEELKLETVTLAEDPRFLVQTLRAYVEQGTIDPKLALERERRIRHDAESTVREALRGWRRWVFLGIVRRARARVRDRENLRFERTRVFGVVRRLFVGLGAHLASAGVLDQPRDVFWLTREEVFGWIEGTGVTGDLRGLAARRRTEFETYARQPAPPDRFETLRPVSEMPAEPVARPEGASPSAAELRGTGCCPGVVRARVRIVRDPRSARDLAGHIMVAERTDPGWTLLFPTARGLLVERGSLLSHSAIVAREMGLPCVVGIAELLATLRDDELVEMDGTTGIVRRLEPGVPSRTS